MELVIIAFCISGYPQPSNCLDAGAELNHPRGDTSPHRVCVPLFFKKETQNEAHRQKLAFAGLPLR